MSAPVLYLAGPMSGLPEFNYPAFRAAGDRLHRAGYVVLNPVDNDPGDGVTRPWEWYLRASLGQVVAADAVAVLPDAACSRGAVLELQVARALGMDVRTVDDWVAARGQP